MPDLFITFYGPISTLSLVHAPLFPLLNLLMGKPLGLFSNLERRFQKDQFETVSF